MTGSVARVANRTKDERALCYQGIWNFYCSIAVNGL